MSQHSSYIGRNTISFIKSSISVAISLNISHWKRRDVGIEPARQQRGRSSNKIFCKKRGAHKSPNFSYFHRPTHILPGQLHARPWQRPEEQRTILCVECRHSCKRMLYPHHQSPWSFLLDQWRQQLSNVLNQKTHPSIV